MKRQPFFRREAALFRFGVEAVYGTQRLQHIPAFFGEVRGNVYNLPPSMRQTVGQQNFDTRQLWRVPRESVAHLKGRIALRRALLQNIGEILARMFPAGKVQRDPPLPPDRDDAAGDRKSVV